MTELILLTVLYLMLGAGLAGIVNAINPEWYDAPGERESFKGFYNIALPVFWPIALVIFLLMGVARVFASLTRRLRRRGK